MLTAWQWSGTQITTSLAVCCRPWIGWRLTPLPPSSLSCPSPSLDCPLFRFFVSPFVSPSLSSSCATAGPGLACGARPLWLSAALGSLLGCLFRVSVSFCAPLFPSPSPPSFYKCWFSLRTWRFTFEKMKTPDRPDKTAGMKSTLLWITGRCWQPCTLQWKSAPAMVSMIPFTRDGD